MPRIFITGNAGAGKTTFSKKLAPLCGMEALSLDTVLFNVCWKPKPREERTQIIRQVTAPRSWLIEGISPAVLELADEIIFLDVSRPTAYFRAFTRNLPYWFRSRPGIPEGCPEILLIRRLIRGIWRFHRKHRAPLLRKIADPQTRQTIHHIRTTAEIETLLKSFAQQANAH